jgi:hypothetical protein
MSSVIVKENETLDSALRRFKRNVRNLYWVNLGTGNKHNKFRVYILFMNDDFNITIKIKNGGSKLWQHKLKT